MIPVFPIPEFILNWLSCNKSRKIRMKPILMIQFLISLTGLFGSLFFSEVLKFPPCDLVGISGYLCIQLLQSF